ncbi:MAG: tetratricopeptide repeat protein [Chitinophagaceae bacterium]|nr:tetratricopeptide repeat protein [Chitinophagaceae bacterium]
MERIEKIKAMLKESPGDNFLQHALALEYIKLGRDAEARQLFEEILNRDPGYTGSYYHLAKLLERNGFTDEARKIYEKGMQEALKAGDQHTYNELKSALEELSF